MATDFHVHATLADPILDGRITGALHNGGKSEFTVGGEIAFHDKPSARRPFALGECVARAQLVINKEGVLRVLNPKAAAQGEALIRLVMACEQGAPQAEEHLGKLALALGAADWDALMTSLGGRPAKGKKRVCNLIGWVVHAPVSTGRKAPPADPLPQQEAA